MPIFLSEKGALKKIVAQQGGGGGWKFLCWYFFASGPSLQMFVNGPLVLSPPRLSVIQQFWHVMKDHLGIVLFHDPLEFKKCILLEHKCAVSDIYYMSLSCDFDIFSCSIVTRAIKDNKVSMISYKKTKNKKQNKKTKKQNKKKKTRSKDFLLEKLGDCI